MQPTQSPKEFLEWHLPFRKAPKEMTDRRALLVEVDAATQPDLLAFLRLRGYQCVAASSADEAEDALAGASFSFTLVDLNGNGTDAATLIQCLKLHVSNSGPIIAFADLRGNGRGAF